MKQYHPTLYFTHKGATRSHGYKLANPMEMCEFPVVSEPQRFDFNQYNNSEVPTDNAMAIMLAEVERCYGYLVADTPRYTLEKHQTIVLHCDSTHKRKYSTSAHGDGSKENPFTSIEHALAEIGCIAATDIFANQSLYFKINLTGNFKNESVSYAKEPGCVSDVHILIDGGTRMPVIEDCTLLASYVQVHKSREYTTRLYCKGIVFRSTHVYSRIEQHATIDGTPLLCAAFCDYMSSCIIEDSSIYCSLIDNTQITNSAVYFAYCTNCMLSSVSMEGYYPSITADSVSIYASGIVTGCTLVNCVCTSYSYDYRNIVVFDSYVKYASSKDRVNFYNTACFAIVIEFNDVTELCMGDTLLYSCNVIGNVHSLLLGGYGGRRAYPVSLIETSFECTALHVELYYIGLVHTCKLTSDMFEHSESLSLKIDDIVNTEIKCRCDSIFITNLMLNSNIVNEMHVDQSEESEEPNAIISRYPLPKYAEHSSVHMSVIGPVTRMFMYQDYGDKTLSPYKDYSFFIHIPNIHIGLYSNRYHCQVYVDGLPTECGTEIQYSVPIPTLPKCPCETDPAYRYVADISIRLLSVDRLVRCGTKGSIIEMYGNGEYCNHNNITYTGTHQIVKWISCSDSGTYTEPLCD